MINIQELVEIKTQTNDRVIHFFAFVALSSAQNDVIYKIQEITNENNEITATYFIISEIIFQINT